MTREIELKFPVADREAVRQAVLRAGGEYAGTVLQTDRYFDTPGRTLMRQDRGLRVRTEDPVAGKLEDTDGEARSGRACNLGPKGGVARGRALANDVPRATSCTPYALVTYKGPRKAGGRAKNRREIQTHVAEARAVEEMLTELGLAKTLVIQKRRSTYRLGGCLVELDELPMLGTFVEIEGSSVRAVEAVVRKLGITGEPTKDSYVHLAVAACRRAGKSFAEITFRRCGSRRRPSRRA